MGVTKLTISATAITQGVGSFKSDNQEITFGYRTDIENKDISMILSGGIVSIPEIEFIISKKELKKILDFMELPQDEKPEKPSKDK